MNAAARAACVVMITLPSVAPAPACDTWTIGAGVAHLSAPSAGTRAHVRLAPSAATLAGIPPAFDLHGLSAEPESARTLALGIGCEWSSRWGLQVEAGVPPTIGVKGAGIVTAPGPTSALLRLDLDEDIPRSLVDQKVWSPIVALRYRPGTGADARLRPFVSVGVSYTWFTDEPVRSGFDEAIDQRFGQPLALAALRPGRTRTRVAVDPQWAPVLGAGVDWRLAPRWRLAASLGYSPLHVEAHFRTRAADGAGLARARSQTDLDVWGAALVLNYELFAPDD